MTSVLKRNVRHIAIGGALYYALKLIKVPNNISAFISSSWFVYFVDKTDLEFFIPLTLSHSLVKETQRHGLTAYNLMYSLSMTYIAFQWKWDHTAIPRHFRLWLQKHCGIKRSLFPKFRREWVEREWPSKQFTENEFDLKETMMRCAKQLMINIGKMTLWQVMVGLIISRKLKVNLRKKLQNYMRAVLFCWTIFQLPFIGVVIWNKYMCRFNDSEDPAQYRPSYFKWYLYLVLCLYCGSKWQSKSKQAFIASYIFIQAVLTLMNKNDLNIKMFVPFIAFKYKC